MNKPASNYFFLLAVFPVSAQDTPPVTENAAIGTWRTAGKLDVSSDYYTCAYRIIGTVMPAVGFLNRIALAFRQGKKVYPDEAFAISHKNVVIYKKECAGNITSTRTDTITGIPNGYRFALKHSGANESPHYGGFCQITQSSMNRMIVHIIRAKLPAGYQFSCASNSVLAATNTETKKGVKKFSNDGKRIDMNRLVIGRMIAGLLPLIMVAGMVSAQLNSAGSYVWNDSDLPRVFNNKFQLSFVNPATGFPSYGTVLSGGGYSASQDGGVFQIYFPYGVSLGGVAPEVRLGLYNNQGWSNWNSFYTSANANNTQTDWTTRNLIAYGNILVGKSSQSNTAYRLDVNGNIRADKVVVNTTGADYVFDPSYDLLPIDSLAGYIWAHHHLPGIQPSEEVRNKGISVGDGYTKLLEKIEILTRYVVIQHKTIKQQAEKIRILDDKLSNLKIIKE